MPADELEYCALTIRLWVRGEVIDTALVIGNEDFHGVVFLMFAAKHQTLMRTTLHMIELEFMDEADPTERYQRFGNDPSMMTEPIEIPDRPGHFFDATAPPLKFAPFVN